MATNAELENAQRLTSYLRKDEKQNARDTAQVVLSNLVIAGTVFNYANTGEIYNLPILDQLPHSFLALSNGLMASFGIAALTDGLYRGINSWFRLEETKRYIQRRGFRVRGFFLNRAVEVA
jgi:hypothetical protein